MSEWLKVHAWKACVRVKPHRGFESPPLRTLLRGAASGFCSPIARRSRVTAGRAIFDQEIKAAGQEAVEKTILAELDLNRPRFLAALKEVSGGNEASGTTYTCYASLAALLQTLKGDAVIGSSSNLHAALSPQKSVQLLDEELTIREREAVFPLVYKSIHAGKTAPY